jgi:serine/threonine-protein kinase
LQVLKGLATIQPGNGADGAKVILISGSDRRTLPKLPITLDIPTNQPHTLVATRRGYDQFKLPIKFEDGEVEHTFEVALVELGSGAPAKEPTSSPTPSPTPAPTPRPSPPVNETPAVSGSGNLNMNSIPVSNILVDGRPVGTTPKMAYKVSAGSHTVTFLKDGERKAVPVSVGNGQTKTVAVRF